MSHTYIECFTVEIKKVIFPREMEMQLPVMVCENESPLAVRHRYNRDCPNLSTNYRKV